MLTVKFLLPLLVVDNKKYIIDIDIWAKRKLTQERYQEFSNDKSAFKAYEQEQIQLGRFEYLPDITETFITSDGNLLTVPVGIMYKVAPDFVDHPRFDYWVQCMSEDPDVIVFPKQIVS